MFSRLKKALTRSTEKSNAPSNIEGIEEYDALLAQAKLSGDPFKDKKLKYFDIAEPAMAPLWSELIWPLIQHLDFTCVVDLAAGHGRNSAILRQYAKKLVIVDINQECIDICKQRFRGDKKISYFRNDGTSLKGIEDNSVSLIYSFDSMVHFDSEVIREYLKG